MSAKPDNLEFTKSESKTVGVHGSLIDRLRENSARVVGVLKLAADITLGFSAEPLLVGYSVFAITGRLMMIAFGTKANQKKMAEKHANDTEKLEKHSFL